MSFLVEAPIKFPTRTKASRMRKLPGGTTSQRSSGNRTCEVCPSRSLWHLEHSAGADAAAHSALSFVVHALQVVHLATLQSAFGVLETFQ